jgi:hypothetical protein
MRTMLVVVLAAALALGWAGVAAQQEVRPTPGPGSGTMFVHGTVDIGNVPQVIAMQGGEWRVAVTNPPAPAANGPDFLAPQGRYTIHWPAGGSETVTIVAVGAAGWAQVEHAAGKGARRWVNLAVALSVEEAR